MSLSIIRPGLLTTVQDLGRPGYQHAGLVVSGALDALALRIANLLVGNAETSAGLEITLLGPRLRFETDTLLALTGADLAATLDGRPVGRYRPVWAGAGAELAFGAPVAGCRAYLAVAGGLALAPVLGSRATYLRGRLGGLHGRALQAGDHLPMAPASAAGQRLLHFLRAGHPAAGWAQANWTPGPALDSALGSALGSGPSPAPIIRAMRGPEYGQFAAASQRAFWEQEFVVSAQADRMGYRLHGPALHRLEATELLSSAVTLGTVQVPAGGQAIVLLADRQTTGGYPRLAQVITADFPVLAQLRPGQGFRFREVGLAEAQALYIAQESQVRALQRGLELKLATLAP